MFLSNNNRLFVFVLPKRVENIIYLLIVHRYFQLRNVQNWMTRGKKILNALSAQTRTVQTSHESLD